MMDLSGQPKLSDLKRFTGILAEQFQKTPQEESPRKCSKAASDAPYKRRSRGSRPRLQSGRIFDCLQEAPHFTAKPFQ